MGIPSFTLLCIRNILGASLFSPYNWLGRAQRHAGKVHEAAHAYMYIQVCEQACKLILLPKKLVCIFCTKKKPACIFCYRMVG